MGCHWPLCLKPYETHEALWGPVNTPLRFSDPKISSLFPVRMRWRRREVRSWGIPIGVMWWEKRYDQREHSQHRKVRLMQCSTIFCRTDRALPEHLYLPVSETTIWDLRARHVIALPFTLSLLSLQCRMMNGRWRFFFRQTDQPLSKHPLNFSAPEALVIGISPHWSSCCILLLLLLPSVS